MAAILFVVIYLFLLLQGTRERRKRPQKAEFNSIFDQKKAGQVQRSKAKPGEFNPLPSQFSNFLNQLLSNIPPSDWLFIHKFRHGYAPFRERGGGPNLKKAEKSGKTRLKTLPLAQNNGSLLSVKKKLVCERGMRWLAYEFVRFDSKNKGRSIILSFSYMSLLASESCSFLLYSMLLHSKSKAKHGGAVVNEENFRAANKKKT